MGYKIKFPQSVFGGYYLTDKRVGIILQGKLEYNLGPELVNKMIKADDDDSELKKLKQYRPKRMTISIYQESEKSIYIDTNNCGKSWQTYQLSQTNNIKTVMIGSVEGKWVELPAYQYPTKYEKGIDIEDMSKKPSNIRTWHALFWNIGEINYRIITPYIGIELSTDDVIRIAKSFM